MPGNVAHAIMNIDDNVSVTENYFLVDSLDDWIHGMMVSDANLFDNGDEVKEKDNEIFWKAMYYKILNKDDRKLVRAMQKQVEQMATFEKCRKRRVEEHNGQNQDENRLHQGAEG